MATRETVVHRATGHQPAILSRRTLHCHNVSENDVDDQDDTD